MPETSTKDMERRRHSRASVHMGARCTRLDPYEGGVIDELDIVDISRSGAGAVSENWYYPGQRVVVCLPGDNEHGKRHICATIRRCLSREEDGFRLGLEFDHNSLNTWSNLSTRAIAAA